MTNQAHSSLSIPITEVSTETGKVLRQIIKTTCPYCGVGCGVDVEVETSAGDESMTKRIIGVSGTPEHPANFGRLCVKGTKLLETNDLDGRLLSPKIDGHSVSWTEATKAVADRFSQTIAQYGPDSVAFYVSGQLLTEDYYVANKLMKGYIGSANIDTNSRLCMSSAVASYQRAFGSDTVPCNYEDIDLADMIVLVGSNAAWTHPVLFQRIERAKKLNPQLHVCVIDPRKTATCEFSDSHLAIKPGSDSALFNGLLRYIDQHGLLDGQFIQQHTEGFSDAIDACEQWTTDRVAQFCDIDPAQLLTFYSNYAASANVVSAYSMGVNQSSSGVDKGNAIINCHLATGKIAKPGCGPFSLTGQPNAMGGREVGGLANMLAAHLELNNRQHQAWLQEFWQSPRIADKQGYKAVELFDNIAAGKVKAVWIMATNPVVSMPNRDKIIAALLKCETVVVSDCVANTDTLQFADIALPATGWSEKDGTVTNSERRISRQRSSLPAAGQAKHDWQIICEVAQQMGFDTGFNFVSSAQIFSEHAKLSGLHNAGTRDFDISALANLDRSQYDQLQPIQWPVNQANPHGTKRMFQEKLFFTRSRKAYFVPIICARPIQQTDERYPFVLNSGRVRDQWHTMTRTGKTSTLYGHTARASLSINPQDAKSLNLTNGDFVSVYSASTGAMPSQKDSTSENELAPSKVILPIRLDKGQRRGELFAPIHWSASNGSASSIASLYSDVRDPISGQPELKYLPVGLQKVTYAFTGKLFCARSLSTDFLNRMFDHWSSGPLSKGMWVEFAHDAAMDFNLLRQHLADFQQWLTVSQESPNESIQRILAKKDDKLELVVLLGRTSPQMSTNWIEHLMAQTALPPENTSDLLRGQASAEFTQGALVCSCFDVAEKKISQAIQQGCNSVESLGRELKCGTNCGSCRPELQRLINTSEHSIIL